MAVRSKEKAKKKKRLSAKRYADQHKSGFDRTAVKIPEGVNLFQPKEGNYRLDIVPYKVGEGNPYADEGQDHFERTYFVHKGIGPNNGTYICPAKTAKQKCPVCDGRFSMSKDPDADEETIKALLPKERQLWWIFDYAEPDKGAQLWDVSYHLFGKQLKARIDASDEDDEYEFFADPDEGMTLKVHFIGKSFGGREYVEVDSIDFKRRKEPLSEELLEAVDCLDDLLIVMDYDELKKVYLQTGEADDEDDKPKSKKKAPARGKAKPVDDDDEEDEDEEDEDDAPPVKSKGKPSAAKSKSKPPVDDEEEDDEEEDDEEEDDEEEDDEDDEDDDDEDAPPVKSKKAPARKSPSKAKPPVDDDEDEDDDDEDEDDDDEDEDEPPVKSKSKAKPSPSRKPAGKKR